MSSTSVESNGRLINHIDELRPSLAAFVRTTETRTARLATTSIVAGAVAALSTAGPAVGGQKFTMSAQHALNLSGTSPLGQVLCSVALVAAIVAAAAANLLHRHDSSTRLSVAKSCWAELEALRVALEFDRISLDDAVDRVMKCEEKAIEVRGWRSPPIWRNPFVIAAAAAFLLVVGGLAVVALRPPATPPDSVQLEGDSQFGPAPFTGPVGLDQPGMQLPPWAGGTHFGNASALYAAESDRPSCDAKSLILQLTANPTKAAAWVEPMGLSTRDLGPFVNSLTPVYLRADTAVTDYAYSKNSSHGYPSILQEGTAVLVNSYGEPTVKCFSGDPLGPSTGSIDSKNYSGDPWDTFQADKVCRILPAPSEVQSYVLVDSISGDHVTTPAKPDPKPVKGPNPEPAGGATTPG